MNLDTAKTDQPNDASPRNQRRPADYLDREAQLAYGAVIDRLEEISARLQPSAALGRAIERHPWRTTAAASAVGFFAGLLLSGRRRGTAASTESLKQAAMSTPPAAPAGAARPPWWISLVGPTLEVARVFAERWAIDAIAARSGRGSPQPADGKSPEGSADGAG